MARNMRDALPNASFIGCTGTPIEQKDANTRAVFGEYVSVYDVSQTVIDKATVPIDYENRIAKPMRGHGLMQAIARIFRDKQSGLIFDYRRREG